MNEKHLKKIALELLSHSEHFEPKARRTLQHAIEALSMLSDLEAVAKKSLKEAFQAAQIAMEKTIEKAAEKSAVKTESAVARSAQTKTLTDPKIYTQWIEKLKPEYRNAFKNPALFQAFLKIQSQISPAKTEVRATTRPASTSRGVAPLAEGKTSSKLQGKPKSTDFSPTAAPQIGATVEKPGSALRRKPLGTNPVLRPKRPT